ncbi:hypothetical protein B0H21DRAFT_382174 [Amylocystis lapponica]|nr:hypothetical protein B0H21DRAFT_382174 [Amylocystis lapponica]
MDHDRAMDLSSSDPAMVKEMVKRLGNELLMKAVQQQLRDLQDQHDSRSPSEPVVAQDTRALKEENIMLKNELDNISLQSTRTFAHQDSRPHMSGASPDENLTRLLAEVQQEKERTDEEHAKAIARLEEKVGAYKQKYKNLKQSQSENVQELESQRDDALHRAVSAEAECAMVTSRLAEAMFDAVAFLALPNERTEQPSFQMKDPVSTTGDFILTKEIKALSDATTVVKYTREEVIWPDEGYARCLVLSPIHRYIPGARKGNGLWERIGSPHSRHRTTDLFLQNKNACHYMGTFKSAGSTTLSLSDVKKLGSRYSDHIEKRTAVSSDLVPPVITNMMKKMYAEGVLKIECFGLRCIGFNKNLDKTFQVGAGKRKATTIAVPKEGSTGSGHVKRGCEGDPQGPSRKKSKK